LSLKRWQSVQSLLRSAFSRALASVAACVMRASFSWQAAQREGETAPMSLSPMA
jgi:hypothetical protein